MIHLLKKTSTYFVCVFFCVFCLFGVQNSYAQDTDMDGILDSLEGTVLDTDSDGVANYLDIDSDNDGLLDGVECPGTAIPSGDAAGIAESSSVANPSNAIGNGDGRANINANGDYLIVDLGYQVPINTVIFINSRRGGNGAGTGDHEMQVDQTNTYTIGGSSTFTNLKTASEAGAAYKWDFSQNIIPTPEINHEYTILVESARYLRIRVIKGIINRGAIQIDNVFYASFSLAGCRDSDQDGVADYLDLDSDNDGIIDRVEAQNVSGFIEPAFDPDETYVSNNGLNSNYLPSGLTAVDTDSVETDPDLLPDYLDYDSDDDGIPDNIEAQSTLGYLPPTGDVGTNGLDSAYDFTDNYNSQGLTLIDTDEDVTPDFRDLNSDNDDNDGVPILDSDENGISDSRTLGANNDDDGDGLNDAFDLSGLAYDVNDILNTPSTDLPDEDSDVNLGGDLDYRDVLTNVDSDQDGVADVDDLDDDNDGILDVDECLSVSIDGNSSISVPTTISLKASNGINSLLLENLAEDGQYINMNVNGAFITVDLGLTVVAGTPIRIEASSNSTLIVLRIDESANNVEFTNTNQTYAWDDVGYTLDSLIELIFTPTNNTRYVKILLDVRDPGFRVRINKVSYDSFTNPCGGDTDSDTIPDAFDLDSDNDGILDNVEAQAAGSYLAPASDDEATYILNNGVNSSYVGGSNPIDPNLDTDSDGSIPDRLDLDSDNDGIPDNIEWQTTQAYLVPTLNYGDNGVDAAYENNDTYIISINVPNNFSGTGEYDYRSVDSDGDANALGDLDAVESGLAVSGALGDIDADGLLDTYDADTSGFNPNNGIIAPVSELTDTDGDANALGDLDYRDTSDDLDTDGDGIKDTEDIDDDNDGILDTVEDAAADDVGIDDIANSLDIDSDDDGIPDNIEAQPTVGYIAPTGIDSDNDGLDNAYEGLGDAGINPVNTDTLDNPDYLDLNSDNDAFSDSVEIGYSETPTSGVDNDTDGDGLYDIFEGSNIDDADVNDEINNPLLDLPDTDGDAVTDDVDYRDNTDSSVAPAVPGNLLWLRADIGVTGTTNITKWEDQTTSVYEAIPNSNGPSLNISGPNFNPTLTFDSSNSENLVITGGVLGTAISYDNLWIYTVAKTVTNNIDNYLFQHNVVDDPVFLQLRNTTNDITFATSSGGDLVNGTAEPNDFNIWNAGFSTSNTSTPSGAYKSIYKNGELLDTGTTPTTAIVSSATDTNLKIGSKSAAFRYFEGDISELLIFSSLPSSADQQQIQSYLAIKYGITLDDTGTDADIVEGDYILFEKTIKVWDYGVNSAYHNDVAGIGRDDEMALIQKQSKSKNTTSFVTIGVGEIAASNIDNSNNINSNRSFLMWGHNGEANSTSNTAADLLCVTEREMNRIWKVQETGVIGSVQIQATQTIIETVLGTSNTIYMKVADDAAFTMNVKYVPLTLVGSNYEANYDFDDANYFTFASAPAVFWNGDTATWFGGSGTLGAPNNTDDTKVLVIDTGDSPSSAVLSEETDVACACIKENTKLIVNSGVFLTLKDNLQLDGEIRMLGNSELIQTHTSDFSNLVSGTGKLYIDQQSKVASPYRYNWWSSPVVSVAKDTGYILNAVMKDGTSPTTESSVTKDINFYWPLTGSASDPISISYRWIYKFIEGRYINMYYDGVFDDNLFIGDGYLMRSSGRNPQNFTFVGLPNDGKIEKTIPENTGSFLGNPYPSALNGPTFIADNDNIDGAIYLWEAKGDILTPGQNANLSGNQIGGYSLISASITIAGVSLTSNQGAGYEYTVPNENIAVGQGFYVSAGGGVGQGGVVEFNNGQRAGGDGASGGEGAIFFKSGKNSKKSKTVVNSIKTNLKLGFNHTDANTNLSYHRQLGIDFRPGNTLEEYDRGYDSYIFDKKETDMFWSFPEIDTDLLVAGVQELQSGMEIPIAFSIESELPVTIEIDDRENMDGYQIKLRDYVTGQTFDIEYGVELDLEKGNYLDRFTLLFYDESVLSVVEQDSADLSQVYIDRETKQLVVENSEAYKIEVYSVLGVSVLSWSGETVAKEKRIDAKSLPDGTYIVKLFDSKKVITKKIISY